MGAHLENRSVDSCRWGVASLPHAPCTWSWLGPEFWLWREKGETRTCGDMEEGPRLLDPRCLGSILIERNCLRFRQKAKLTSQTDMGRKIEPLPCRHPALYYTPETIICPSWEVKSLTLENRTTGFPSLLSDILILFHKRYNSTLKLLFLLCWIWHDV